jgi:tetratricopeptide (TPR) repeat protein
MKAPSHCVLAVHETVASAPADFDVQTLTAEAMMNSHAWNLWTLDGAPAPGTDAIVTLLESVLAKDPRHPGANHYYIHAVEASPDPAKAVPAAERLSGMLPAAGHLEHMPAHIMQRVGRYEAAAEANRKGVAADLAYYAATKPLDYYVMYTAHNYQFLAFSAAMEGRQAETIEGAPVARAGFRRHASDDAGTDWWRAFAAMVRFGMWTRPRRACPTRSCRTDRRVSYATVQRSPPRAGETPRHRSPSWRRCPREQMLERYQLNDVLAVAVLTVKARIALAEGRDDEATGILREAVAQEDQLAYDEPADWFFPARHILGAVLIRAGRGADAEAVYRDDLSRHPNNGWALYGLAQALHMEGRGTDALAAQQRFDTAWKNADITLSASAF